MKILAVIMLLPTLVLASQLNTEINIGNPADKIKQLEKNQYLTGQSIKCQGVDATQKVLGAEINDIVVTSAFGEASLVITTQSSRLLLCRRAAIFGMSGRARTTDMTKDLIVECENNGRGNDFGSSRFGNYSVVLRRITNTQFAGDFRITNLNHGGTVGGIVFDPAGKVQMRCEFK